MTPGTTWLPLDPPPDLSPPPVLDLGTWPNSWVTADDRRALRAQEAS